MYGGRPVIGICPLFDEKRDSYWMLPGYMQMLEAQGAVPMMLPLTADPAVLGICRGHQLMNAALGGSLYQDVAAQHEAPINHRMQPPYDGVAHEVTLIPGSPMAALLDCERIGVNSCHHQAIRDLAPCLEVQAAAADGIAEAVYMPGKKFVWGVQWHPEFAWKVSQPNRSIVAAFLKAAGKE